MKYYLSSYELGNEADRLKALAAKGKIGYIPSKRNKGEHTFEEVALPNNRYPYFHTEWEENKMGFRKGGEVHYTIYRSRQRLFVCTSCGKEDVIFENEKL
jgi:hypothetical protein